MLSFYRYITLSTAAPAFGTTSVKLRLIELLKAKYI